MTPLILGTNGFECTDMGCRYTDNDGLQLGAAALIGLGVPLTILAIAVAIWLYRHRTPTRRVEYAEPAPTYVAPTPAYTAPTPTYAPPPTYTAPRDDDGDFMVSRDGR